LVMNIASVISYADSNDGIFVLVGCKKGNSGNV
jgi:hypothetical protein